MNSPEILFLFNSLMPVEQFIYFSLCPNMIHLTLPIYTTIWLEEI